MEDLLNVLKALADQTRLSMVKLLLSQDFCVGALAKRLELTEATVSQHLQVLRKAGIVKGEKKGYYTHYVVNTDILKKVAVCLEEMSTQKRQCMGECGNQKVCHNPNGGEDA